MASWLAGGLSLGGVTGGAGTLGTEADAVGGSELEEPRAEGRSAAELEWIDGGCCLAAKGVCRRISDSLAMMPRLRRNGILDGLVGFFLEGSEHPLVGGYLSFAR